MHAPESLNEKCLQKDRRIDGCGIIIIDNIIDYCNLYIDKQIEPQTSNQETVIINWTTAAGYTSSEDSSPSRDHTETNRPR